MKRTRQEAEVTRITLLDTAFREFVEGGFDNTSLEMIASNAGMTRGALYWHFKDKNELLGSIIEYKDIESLKISAEIFNSGIDPLDKLKKIIGLGLPEINNRKKEINYVRMKVELYNYFIKNGDPRGVAQNFIEMCQSLLTELRKQKRLRDDINIRYASFTLLNLTAGSFIRFNSLPEKIRSMKTLRKILFDYLKTILK